MKHSHLISINDLDDQACLALSQPFDEAPARVSTTGLQTGSANLLFQQNSLRTAASFCAAAVDVGLTPVLLNASGSVVRDQCDLFDELEQLSHLGKVVVVRSSRSLATLDPSAMACPVVNAGDADNEHPSQALLDLLAMRSWGLGQQETTVALMGNLKEHRVNHSLYLLLRRLSRSMGFRIVCISAPGLGLPERYLQGEQASTTVHLETTEAEEVNELLCQSDFVYLTPMASWANQTALALPALNMNFSRSQSVLMPHAKVLHPFPRLGELDYTIDNTTYDGYRLQTPLGPRMRSRLLRYVLTR